MAEIEATVETETASTTAADVMTSSPRTCSPFSTIVEVVLVMNDVGCSFVPVTNGGKLVGTVTDRDIALALAHMPDLATRPVTDVMTTNTVTIKENASIAEVRAAFAEDGVNRIFVIDAEENLVGVITASDLASSLINRVAEQA